MEFLLSAKHERDLLSWRGATDFIALFREKLIERLEGGGSWHALQALEQVLGELDEMQCANTTALDNACGVEELLFSVTDMRQLRQITADSYAVMYDHVSRFHSPTAFYEQSSLFLQTVAATILHFSRERLGLLERHLPEHALIALGPAGRKEFSPFCPLQMVLVCRHDNAIEKESLRQYGALVHEGFEMCGLRVDSEVSPKCDDWCSSLEHWQSTLRADLVHAEQDELINLLRLDDQIFLAGSHNLSNEFCSMAKKALSESDIALENLVSRASLLSNGLGLLGGLRLEKSGPYRGCFPLLDHALQPLTASISAFALLSRLGSETSPERIRELVVRGELGVDMAEQLLHGWNDVNELRLMHERESQPNWMDVSPLHVDLDTLSHDEQESLRKKLEAIGHFQRYLHTTFTALGR